jgi:hypothetical protein
MTASVDPISCSPTDTNCSAYYFPGGMRGVSPSQYTLKENPEATGFVVHQAPGYQLDFLNLRPTDAAFNMSSCYFNGYDAKALLICLAQSGTGYVIGTQPLDLF